MTTITDYMNNRTVDLDVLATRAQKAIDAKGPLPIPGYAGLSFYNDFVVRGDSLYGQKVRRWFAIAPNDAIWLDGMLSRHGF